MTDLKSSKRYIAIFFLLAVVVLLRLFVVEIKRVEDWQMFPSFYQNDFFVLNKIAKKPELGEVYFFADSEEAPGGLYRVLGLAGDKVQYWAGRLSLNGQKLDEMQSSVSQLPFGKSAGVDLSDMSYMKYISESLPNKRYSVIAFESGTKENLEEVIVPEDKLFVLKDFRSFGLDSRKFGFVSKDKIRGKAMLTLYSCTELLGDSLAVCDFFKFRKGRFFTRIP